MSNISTGAFLPIEENIKKKENITMATIPTPVISPNGGGISMFDGIEITCADTTKNIYYTVDGSDPADFYNQNASLYDPVTYARIIDNDYEEDNPVYSNTQQSFILKAVAEDPDTYEQSAVATSQPFIHYAADPWRKLVDAVAGLGSGNQTVTFSYSFMLPNTSYDDDQGGQSLTVGLDRFANFSESQFKQTCIDAFAYWKTFLEAIFNQSEGFGGNLTVNFVSAQNSNGGVEIAATYPSRLDYYYPIPNPVGAGDIRIGIGNLGWDNGGTGAYTVMPLGPLSNMIASVNGDIIVNGDMPARREDQPLSQDDMNLVFVITHELGHALACLIDDFDGTFVAKLMAYTWSGLTPSSPSAHNMSSLFPNGMFVDCPWEKQRVKERHTIYAPQHPDAPTPIISPDDTSPISAGQTVAISLP